MSYRIIVCPIDNQPTEIYQYLDELNRLGTTEPTFKVIDFDCPKRDDDSPICGSYECPGWRCD